MNLSLAKPFLEPLCLCCRKGLKRALVLKVVAKRDFDDNIDDTDNIVTNIDDLRVSVTFDDICTTHLTTLTTL